MPQQANLGPLPHWDLSNVYPSLESDELKRDIAQSKGDIDALIAFLDEHHINKGATAQGNDDALQIVLNGYLDRANDLFKRYYTIRAYLHSFITTDSYNQTARRIMSEIEPLGVQMDQIETRFTGWIGDIRDALPRLTTQGAAKAHAFYLHETAEQSRYLMSEAEEALASELNLSGANAWSKLHGTITSQLAVEFERDGKTEKLPMPALINIQQHDPDAEVRRSAYETEIAAWDGVKETLAAAMNGVKGEVITLNKRRGRPNALHSALDQGRIDQITLDAMLGAMQDSFPMFRKYWRAKANRLGHSAGLPWWDLMAPAGHNERVYSWDEARQFVLAHFAAFSDRLTAMAQTAFDKRWIDAEQRPGKRAGAFCMGVPAVEESRILCNFDGSLDQVSTIAHELGHAFHNECLKGKPMLQTITPMTLAETASIFCETIIVDAALADAKSGDEELSILETDLIGKSQVIVDITSRFLFETEVFKRREKAELSADELSELMLDCQRQTYGDGLDERYLHKYMWTWKPHYYRAGLSFYNFPYAFGLLFATGLYAIYKREGKSFVPAYEQLLASTGEGTAADLASRFGIDIRSKAFWQASLDLIGERVDRYCAI